MRPSTKNKQDRMLIAEVRKLAKAVPGLLKELGFTQTKPMEKEGLGYDDLGEWTIDCPHLADNLPLKVLADCNPLNFTIHREHPEYQALKAGPTTLTVHPIMDLDGHPWLACQFDRERLYPGPWQAGDIRNLAYYDLEKWCGAASYSGKYNCRIFERWTAEEALDIFRRHLGYVLP